jgi:hypothetical protein
MQHARCMDRRNRDRDAFFGVHPGAQQQGRRFEGPGLRIDRDTNLNTYSNHVRVCSWVSMRASLKFTQDDVS